MHKNPGNRWSSILAMLAVAALVGAVALSGAQQPETAHAQNNAAPSITSVEFTSSPASGDAYRFEETIQVTVTFDQAVKVHESHDGVHEPDERELEAAMGLIIGNHHGEAEYTSGSGTDTLVFEFPLNWEGYVDHDGVSVPPNSRPRDHWTPRISDLITSVSSGTPFNDLHDGIDDSSGHKVLGRPSVIRGPKIVSAPESGDTYGVGENIYIAMTYNWPVEVEGEKFMGLRVGTGSWWRGAAYNFGSGTKTLVFRYVVQPGDFDDGGISIDGAYPAPALVGTSYLDGAYAESVLGTDYPYGYSGSGTIKAVGTDLEVLNRYPLRRDNPAHKVDGVVPTISSIGFTNASGDDNTYGVGDTITVYVNFSEDVLTLGSPQLTLDFDGTEKTASYQPPPDAWHPLTGEYDPIPKPFAAFTYTVQVGDMDADGIALSANALNLNGGSIQDAAGNNADISHDALPSNAAHMVSAPGGL